MSRDTLLPQPMKQIQRVLDGTLHGTPPPRRQLFELDVMLKIKLINEFVKAVIFVLQELIY